MRCPKVSYSDNKEMIFRPLRMQCTHCSEVFSKTNELYAHIRTHENYSKCPHCDKSLKCMATFVYHVRTHTMEKPYYCPVDGCNFTNAVKYNLKVHLASIRHGGPENLKKYAKVLDLDVCDKSLKKRKDSLVHSLGPRRSKKRRKLNKNKIKTSSSSEYGTTYNHQLLFTLPPNTYNAYYSYQPQYAATATSPKLEENNYLFPKQELSSYSYPYYPNNYYLPNTQHLLYNEQMNEIQNENTVEVPPLPF